MASPWRTDAHQARRRAAEQRILAAAMDLVGTRGFPRLPVARVAQRAGVSLSAAAREAVRLGRNRLDRSTPSPRRLVRERVHACSAYLGARPRQD